MLRRLLIAGLSLGSLPSSRAAGQSAADSASVQAFYAEWFGSLAQGPAAYASFYAVDGCVLPPSLPAVRGREAIAEWLASSQATATFTARPEGLSVDEVRFLGPEWVVQRTTLRGRRVPKAGGDAVPFETKYLDLLHRAATGRWEVAYRMWSDSR
jgi:uncharacterized protein (TIGR02246 family)